MPLEPITRTDQVVIEIGCGPSNTRRADSSGSAIGVDIDLRTLQSPGGASRRRCVCADALALPLRSSTCDLLIAEAVLHHLVPTDRAMEELARVLRPNGRLQVADGVALPPDEAAALDTELRATGLPSEPIYGFDLDELSAFAAEAGLEVVDVRTSGRSTFATPPFASRTYSSERFILTAQRTPTG